MKGNVSKMMEYLLSRRQLGLLLGASGMALFGFSVCANDRLFPDVLAVKIRAVSDDTFDFDVTVSSTYDRPSRYADGFRVVTQQGALLGARKLWHDHQGEQPFTRDLHGVKVPKNLRVVVVQARDQVNGYGGKAIVAALPGR